MGQVKPSLTERITAAIAPVCESQGLELVEVEWLKDNGRQCLRISIDKPGGILLDDCAAASRAFDAPLEALSLAEYALEVSSPGAERALKTDRDFERYAGRLVDLRVSPPLDGQRKFSGRLIGHDSETIRLAGDDGEVTIPRANVTVAKLALVMPGSKHDVEGGRPVVSL